MESIDYYRQKVKTDGGVRKTGERTGVIHDTRWTQIIPHFRVEEGGKVIPVKQSDGSTTYHLYNASLLGETVINGQRPYARYPKRRKPSDLGFETKAVKIAH